MVNIEISVGKQHSDSLIPISIIEYLFHYYFGIFYLKCICVFRSLDKSSSTTPIEDLLKNDFQETERINLELREMKTRFKELSDKLFT